MCLMRTSLCLGFDVVLWARGLGILVWAGPSVVLDSSSGCLRILVEVPEICSFAVTDASVAVWSRPRGLSALLCCPVPPAACSSACIRFAAQSVSILSGSSSKIDPGPTTLRSPMEDKEGILTLPGPKPQSLEPKVPPRSAHAVLALLLAWTSTLFSGAQGALCPTRLIISYETDRARFGRLRQF